MRHICYLTNEYPKPGIPHGGIGSFLKTITGELVERGFRVTVIGMSSGESYEESDDNGVQVYRLKNVKVKALTWWINKNAFNKKMREVHRQYPIDVVESSELGLAFVNKIKGIKYIIRLHGGHHFFSEAENRKVDFWKGYQEKKSFAKADAFIAVSEFVKSHTAKYLSYHQKEVALIHYPINVGMFHPMPVAIIPESIVFAGTVCEKKGVRQLVEAFPKVKMLFPNAKLHVYGRDLIAADGTSYIKMLQETVFPNLGSCVNDIYFYGPMPQNEIALKYASAEVCVFPSHMETQGLVAPEAMAMQKMVIFTKLGPGPETITDFETGLLCDPYNPDDIAEKINWVFAHKEQAGAIGKKAHDFVLQRFAPEAIVQRNIVFYESVVRGSSKN